MASNEEPASRLLPPAARKRKASLAESGAGHATKYRSSQACVSCRTRKVRCDVLANGSQCTNCRLDGTECVVLASRRGKTHRNPRQDASNKRHYSPRIAPPPDPVSDTSQAPGNDRRPATEAMFMPTPPRGADDVPVCVTFDEDHQGEGEQRTSDDCVKNQADHSPSMTQGARGNATLEGWHMDQSDLSSHPSTGPNYFDRHQGSAGKAMLPIFITPLPAHMPNEDLEFLAQKGAFAVPEPELRIEILRSYMFSVHPFMPILDRPAVVDSIVNERDDSTISLLLFQAIMFAGLASLDLQSVHASGFESTKQAREVFFNRVRVLYEFDVEPNDEPLLQSLLLMSWWYGRWNQRRDTWHWTGLALSVAQNLGLHREPTTKCGSDKTRHFRRRLWWSLYIRDRLLALGTRRPMRIRDDNFDVAMLTLDDFEVNSVCESGYGPPLTPDVEDAKCTALMCIELAKLSICIGHVLSAQYTALKTQPDVPYTMMIVPKREKDRTPCRLEECDKEINEWFQALGPETSRPRPPTAPNGSHSCSEVHRALLSMVHLTLINVLHRTQAVRPSTDSAEAQAAQKKSRSKVKEASRNVTKLTYTMLRRDQARFLGVPGVTALMAACLSHMVDIRMGDEDLRDASIFRFYQNMQVLQSLRGIYASADSAVSFIASVVRKAGISVPAQVAAPAPDFLSASPDRFDRLATPSKEDGSWKGTTVPCQARRSTVANGQPTLKRRESASSQRPQQPTRRYSHTVFPYDLDPEIPQDRSVTIHSRTQADTASFPSTMQFADHMHATTSDAPARQRGMSQQFAIPPPEGVSYPAANPSIFNWNNTLSPINFDGDFSSDAFGHLHGQFQDLDPFSFDKDFGLDAFGSLNS